jgi:hypothetical protein
MAHFLNNNHFSQPNSSAEWNEFFTWGDSVPCSGEYSIVDQDGFFTELDPIVLAKGEMFPFVEQANGEELYYHIQVLTIEKRSA